MGCSTGIRLCAGKRPTTPNEALNPEQESDCVLAADLANPGHGHEQVPFLCLCDSNTEARVMYEAGVRYVIQSEALAVQPPCLALTRPPCANARTRSRLEPVAALCVNEGCMHHTARTRRQLTARTHGVFFFLCTQGARYSAADAQPQFAGKSNIHGRLHPTAQRGHATGAGEPKSKEARAILGRGGVNPWRFASVVIRDILYR